MDDNAAVRVPTSVWLTFALSQTNAVSLCRRLRETCPNPVDTGQLIQHYLEGHGDLAERLQEHADPATLAQMRSSATAHKVEQALQWQQAAANRHLLGLDHPAYPTLLQDTLDAPVLLYAEGSLEALRRPLVAAVGSRKASHSALSHTRALCSELAAQNIGIVSGLARGIDKTAHEAALSVNGTTIAVAATAPGKIYPRQHVALAAEILTCGGLILTEYGLGAVTRPWFFPQRNRIISGISLGVLVAEAGLPSGTLTTATHAMNQGREVMAVPGSVHNLQARGCHALIKQGAALVENTQDIVDALGEPLQRGLRACGAPERDVTDLAAQACLPFLDSEPAGRAVLSSGKAIDALDTQDKQLLDWLSRQPASLDELMTLAQQSDQPWAFSSLSTALGLLEIRGYITAVAGGRYARC